MSERFLTRHLDNGRADRPSRARLAAAIGLGVYIGCVPLLGPHVWLSTGLGRLLGLNSLRVLLERFGFAADAIPDGAATPFVNVLIRARRVA
jgi:hypothetical protein